VLCGYFAIAGADRDPNPASSLRSSAESERSRKQHPTPPTPWTRWLCEGTSFDLIKPQISFPFYKFIEIKENRFQKNLLFLLFGDWWSDVNGRYHSVTAFAAGTADIRLVYQEQSSNCRVLCVRNGLTWTLNPSWSSTALPCVACLFLISFSSTTNCHLLESVRKEKIGKIGCSVFFDVCNLRHASFFVLSNLKHSGRDITLVILVTYLYNSFDSVESFHI
jgi:hypothetical protein